MKRKLKRVNIMASTLLIGFLFYILNYYTPLFADDYSYSFSFMTGNRIESVSQIIESQIGHYYNTNGRSVTHTLAQLFLLAGDKVFNYINTVGFLLLIYLVYFHACGSFKSFSAAKFSLVAMLIFLSCPAFGQSFLWITGAANYLYGILIILVFLLPYRIQIKKQIQMPLGIELVAALIFFFLGVIAGWTNENTAIAVIVMITGYIVLYYVKGYKICGWHITGFIGAIVGCVVMLFSPGTASRLQTAGGSGGIVAWIKRFIFISCDMVINLHLLLLFMVMICAARYISEKQRSHNGNIRQVIGVICEKYGITGVYALGFLASVYSMIVSPQFPDRAWSGPVILSVVLFVNLISENGMEGALLHTGKRLAFLFVLILSASIYLNAFFELKNVDVAYDERVSIIEAAICNGDQYAVIPDICGWTGYSCYSISGDLKSNSSEWPNTAIAKYYGIDEIAEKIY